MSIKIPSRLDKTTIMIVIPEGLVNGVRKGLKTLCGKYLTSFDYLSAPYVQTMKASFFIKHGVAAMRVFLIHAYKKVYLKYEFNPNNLTTQEFQKFIVDSTCMGMGCYSHVLNKGTIPSFEIAVDFLFEHTQKYVFHQRYVHDSEFVTSGFQKGGSYYLGSRKGKLQLTAYDKSEEQKAKGKTFIFSELMRIEARYSQQKFNVHTLEDVPNKLPKLIIYPLATLLKLPHPEIFIWKQFLLRARLHGVPRALEILSKERKKQFVDLLLLHAAKWWKPETLMKGFAERARIQLQYQFAINCKTT